MNDFDELLNGIKKGLGSLAEDMQQKYGELVEYLDTHDSDQIKADLREKMEKATEGAKEDFGKVKDETIDKIGDHKEDIREGLDKMRQHFDDVKQKAQEELKDINVDEKMAEARQSLEEGMGKAKEMLGEGMDVVQRQFNELKKYLNL